MEIKRISPDDTLKELLLSCELPVSDIDSNSSSVFLGAFEFGSLLGVVATEIYGVVGLLRSLAVGMAFRNSGVGAKLVEAIELSASEQGVRDLYLLTSTAEAYFLKHGYARLPRDEAPEFIQSTSQFKGVCPASAVLLTKKL